MIKSFAMANYKFGCKFTTIFLNMQTIAYFCEKKQNYLRISKKYSTFVPQMVLTNFFI